MQRGGLLRVTEEDEQGARAFKAELSRRNDDGTTMTVPARDAAWDGTTLTFRTLRADAQIDCPDAAFTATVDRDTKPHTLKGTMKNEHGAFQFDARRVDPKQWWTGRWRVVETRRATGTTLKSDDQSATVEAQPAWAPPQRAKT
jgi:hypothetical protein